MKKIDRSIDNLKKYPKFRQSLLWVLVLLFGIANAPAENASSGKEQKSRLVKFTKETLQAKVDAINARQDVDEAIKAKILKLYQSSLDNLTNIQNYKTQETYFKQSIKQAPAQAKKVEKEIEQIQPKLNNQSPEDFTKIPSDELEQRLIIEKGKISDLDDQLTKLENELAVQNSRPPLIRQETLTAQQDLDAAQKKVEIRSSDPLSKLENEAQHIFLKSLSDARTSELSMLDAESVSNPARIELLKTQIQLLNLQKSALTQVTGSIESNLTERRQQEAKEMQDALSQSEKDLAGKPPLIQKLTRENIQYSLDLSTVTERIEYYNDQKTKLDALMSQLDSDYKSAEKKISLAGLSPALGKILYAQRRNLLAQDPFTSQSEAIQNETASTSLAQFKTEDSRKQLMDVDTQLKIMMSQVDPKLPTDQRMMIQAQARVLINNQIEALNKLSIAYSTYLRTLGDFDFACQQLLKLKTKFKVYLDEKLLWVKSSDPINKDFAADLYHSAQWLLSPSNWFSTTEETVKITYQNLFLSLTALFIFVFLLFGKKYVKQKIRLYSEKVEKIYTDNFSYTLLELAYTLVLVLPIPLFIHFFGKFLASHHQVADFTKDLGEGLQATSIPLFFLQFFYRLFSPAGIARKHFQWSLETTNLLRKQIAWIRFVIVPCVFLVQSTAASKVSEYGDSLGRTALIINMFSMAVFFSRLLNPAQGIVKDYYKKNLESWFTRLRYVWYSSTFLVPLIIIGFAVAGYYFSALELQQKLVTTIRLIFILVIIHALVIRWLTLVNRQLAIKNAQQKRKALEHSEKPPADTGAEDPVLPPDEQQIDIPKLNTQTIKLLHVFTGFSLLFGFWIIWENIFPAFSFLDNIVLWQHKVTVNNQESDQPITLTNLILAGFYVFIIIVAIRNIYGVMELLVFRHMAIESGNRYAVNQLARYALSAVGVVCVANELGGSWSQVQWLVAALGVGLGFGLQEIFANLVSGIILLFERPIRIGDTVTIGAITGKVSRIQMRATTLIDFDQKDLIVPNKTFITSQLINWTLTDPVTRIVVPIGIAYNSDVELAHQVMIDTVRSTPLVLAEPAPSVLFTAFGDSSLDFTIRIFVNELANRLPVTHNLLLRLEKALREHNIEIPFPQRDIYIRSMPKGMEENLEIPAKP